MPYNNTPIDPADDVKGTTHLPMSRVKKILAVDDEINQVSNHAVFLCTRAAELFLRHLAQRAYTADKARNKSKKSLQYPDIANLVHRSDNLEFLVDVVPEQQSFREYKRSKRQKEETLAEKKAKKATLAAGQTTLERSTGLAPIAPANHSTEPERPATATAAPTMGNLLNGPVPEANQANGSSELRIRHWEPKANGAGRTDQEGDVNMEG